MSKTLIYIHDPMCSWCWGFEPVRKLLFEAVAKQLTIQRLVGGLAPDSNEPMPQEMSAYLQQTWQRIEKTIPGIRFNYDFWSKNTPRRSTYPANRAVIAARQQGEEFDELMTTGIQQAYYQKAKNPSDNQTLFDAAADIGLDVQRFKKDFSSNETQSRLTEEIKIARSIGVNSFPSLVLECRGKLTHVPLDYNDANKMIEFILAA